MISISLGTHTFSLEARRLFIGIGEDTLIPRKADTLYVYIHVIYHYS